MRVVARTDVAEQAWDREIAAHHATVFHSAAWARYRCAGGRGSPLFLRWHEDGSAEPAALALAIVRPPRRSALGRVVASVQIDGGPCTRRTGVDLVAPLVGWARRRPAVVELRLGSYDQRAAWQPGDPPRPTRRVEFVIRPEPGVDPYDGLRTMARRAVRRAERRGVTVQRTAAAGDVGALADLHLATLQRIQEAKKVVIRAPGRPELTSSLEVLIASGAGHAWVARQAGRVVAGVVFAVHGGTAYHLINGASPDGLDDGAVPLTFVTALRCYAEERYERINLGGTSAEAEDPDSPDHGLYSFKKGLGATAVPCTTGYVAVGRLRTALIARVRRS
ncbi:MAG: hypothetical protein QOC64_1259 [Solirubrobacteraceae bacterium]|nr:hypothetical protein [Solirubrobacteraceae bacterium]